MTIKDVLMHKKRINRLYHRSDTLRLEIWECKKGNMYVVDGYTHSGFVVEKGKEVRAIIGGIFYEVMYGEKNPFSGDTGIKEAYRILVQKDGENEDRFSRIIGIMEGETGDS